MNLPPQNLEAECGVLGSILLDNAALPTVLSFLEAGDFYRASHQILFGGIRDLAGRGEPVDPLTLAAELERRGLLGQVGGHDTFRRLLEGVPHAANAGYYAQIVREKALSRRLVEAAQEILVECYSNDHTAEELLESAERKVFALGAARSGPSERPIGELAAEALARIERRYRNEYAGLAIGLRDFDHLTDGLSPGSVVVLAARPSMGKTALALQVAQFAAVACGVPTLFVSLEMTGLELAERLLIGLARVDGCRVRHGQLTEAHLAALRASCGTLRECPHFAIDDSPGRTLTQVAAAARRLKARSGLGLVVIDYLQLLSPGGEIGPKASRQEQVADLSRRLKILARELDVPVLALSQLNREAERRKDNRPLMSDLRESGALEQDADMVLLLHRPEYYDPNDQPGVAELIVAKNRNGATGTVRLAFQRHLMRFEDFHAGPEVIPSGDF